MKYIPSALLYFRLIVGFVLIYLSLAQISNYPILAVVVLTAGLLSDIFDGIIARRLNVSTELLRRLDSTVDVVFFICVAIATYIQCGEFFKAHSTKLIILVAAEALTYVISFLKFRKEIATHSIGAKIWALSIFATLVEVMLTCSSGYLFEICFWLGLLTRIEIAAIIIALKNWTNDVPSFYHALQLRQGKEIKRNKLFNG